MTVMEKVKDIGRGVLTKVVKPFLEKPHSRITWQAYGKWRTFINSNGRVVFRRFNRQPKDAKVVRNVREARDTARELWGIEVDNRGHEPSTPPSPITRVDPYLGRDLLLSQRSRIGISRHAPRITPTRPRLR